MNTFDFIGKIKVPNNKEDFIKKTTNGRKYISLLIRENENNAGMVHMYGDKLQDDKIPVYYIPQKRRVLLPFDRRFEEKILKDISNMSKYTITYDGNRLEFVWKDDFMDNLYDILRTLPENTIYEVTGDYTLTYRNGKAYNNFNLRHIKVDNSLKPKLKMNLDLFYNYESLDEKDKRNKFVINAYIEQYVFADRKREYFPLQVQFVTNRFDFKKQTDVDIIKHRKANLQPKKEEGFVKASWEAQYVRGAQLIMPPIETLPKDIQFEIENAGRDIREYMSNVVGTASEFICLTRPNNILNKDGAVYVPLNISDEEFKSQINAQSIKETNSIDKIAEEDSTEHPFN